MGGQVYGHLFYYKWVDIKKQPASGVYKFQLSIKKFNPL